CYCLLSSMFRLFFFTAPAPPVIYTLSLHDALPILRHAAPLARGATAPVAFPGPLPFAAAPAVAVRETGYTSWPSLRPHFWIPVRSEEHTSELQSLAYLVCRLLLEKKKKITNHSTRA